MLRPRTVHARNRRFRSGAALLALLAALLRVAWPVPIPVAPEQALAALYGEHALCLSDEHDSEPAQPPGKGSLPAHGSGHAGHHACCQWHGGFWTILPGTDSGIRLAFRAPGELFTIGEAPLPDRRNHPAQARAPPA